MKTQHSSFLVKSNLSLLAGGCVLISFICLLILKPDLRKQLEDRKFAFNETKVSANDLSYIKPLTALVRFTHKVAKETGTKADKNAFQISFPLMTLKPF